MGSTSERQTALDAARMYAGALRLEQMAQAMVLGGVRWKTNLERVSSDMSERCMLKALRTVKRGKQRLACVRAIRRALEGRLSATPMKTQPSLIERKWVSWGDHDGYSTREAAVVRRTENARLKAEAVKGRAPWPRRR